MTDGCLMTAMHLSRSFVAVGAVVSAGPLTQKPAGDLCRSFGGDNAIKLISQAAAFDAASRRRRPTIGATIKLCIQVEVMPPHSVIRYVTDGVSWINLDHGSDERRPDNLSRADWAYNVVTWAAAAAAGNRSSKSIRRAQTSTKANLDRTPDPDMGMTSKI